MPDMNTRKYFSSGHRFLMLAAIIFMLSCGDGSNRTDAAKSGKATVSTGGYVVLSPELAEIIAVLEGTDNIPGRTEECNYPPDILSKTVVGNFGKVNRELILSLKPDIVFATSLEQQAIGADLQKLGIRVVTVYPKSIAELLDGITTVGKAIGKEQRAAAVADSIRKELDALKRTTGKGTRPKIYLEIYANPLMSVSDESYVGEIIEWAGGDNIFAKLERDYSRVKAEDVIRANPDIIICYSRESAEAIRNRMGWQDISALKNNRIYLEKDIDPDWILRAGPRCTKGVRRLQEIMRGHGSGSSTP